MSNFAPKYNIKNTHDFTEKLEDVLYPLRSTIVSFDVTNLFIHIPVKDSIDYMGSLLKEKKLNDAQWRNLKFL